jgi:exodeoxyribonuclease V alpha subunit
VAIQKAYQKAVNDIDVEYEDNAKRYRFYEGDRVVWTKNNYVLGLMNGELGRVVESEPSWIRIAFDTRGEIDIPRAEMDDLSLAWAMTVHKLQGSQGRKVIVVCAEDHIRNYGLRKILNRSWLYTGATRSTEATILLGDESAIRQAIGRDQRDSRITTLFRPSRTA